MPYFLTGFLLLAGFLFWGAGLALLVTPSRYRRFSLIFAAPAGLALQSLAVWLGAHAGFKGTDTYGRVSLLLPVALLAVALWYGRKSGWKKLASFAPLGALMAVQLAVMVLPFALSGRGLTTTSIGSLDAPDYAAGARVLQEFAANDRTGFLGQTEVVSVGVVDNFFDFWLRTNHFTPSALIALNSSVLGLKPYQLTSLLTIVLLTATLPMVFWLARAGLRYRPWTSFAVTTIYAFSPINWYAVYNVAPAQIIAANAIALLTWCGIALWRGGARWSHGPRWAGLLLVSYGLIFGGYNFIIVVCLVPVVAFVGGLTIWKRTWTQLWRWLIIMVGVLLLAGTIYLERGLGVVERLALFKSGFGWTIPVLTPEGWLGMVDGPWLNGYAIGWRALLGALVVTVIIVPMVRGARRRPGAVYLALCFFVPILIGYGYLQFRALTVGPSEGYQAYKLFAVFYPGMLAAFCFWGDLWFQRRGLSRMIGVGGLIAVIGLNVAGEWRFFYRLKIPAFVVDENVVALGKIEQNPAIPSVNMRVDNGWFRLWANAFLLRKYQYFEIHTYEGRRSTALRGEWDLVGNFFAFQLPDEDSITPAFGYTLLRRKSAYFIEAAMCSGWAESLRDAPSPSCRSRWATGEVAALRLRNPQPEAIIVTLSAPLHALETRDCRIKIGGVEVAQFTLSEVTQAWRMSGVVLPPGDTLIEFVTGKAADFVGGRLKTPVTLAVDGFDIDVPGRAGETRPAQ